MLHLENLHKTYGKRPVLQNLSLHIYPGEIYGLLGANGAGKTTTINIICHLLKADSGSVKINGQLHSKAAKRWLGVAPQENLLYKSLTCAENLDFYAQIYGLTKKQRRQRIAATLAAVNLCDKAKSQVETLSGGMQRRLNIAVALVHQPKLIILDEPTTGLDLEARYEIWRLIQTLKQQGTTILLTTHLLDEAQRLCDRIGILKAGKIAAQGSLDELRQLVPAKEILLIQTQAEPEAIACARKWGLIPRRYGNELAFLSSESLELGEIIARFDGISLDSVARQPVQLEHIYLELTQSSTTSKPLGTEFIPS